MGLKRLAFCSKKPPFRCRWHWDGFVGKLDFGYLRFWLAGAALFGKGREWGGGCPSPRNSVGNRGCSENGECKERVNPEKRREIRLCAAEEGKKKKKPESRTDNRVRLQSCRAGEPCSHRLVKQRCSRKMWTGAPATLPQRTDAILHTGQAGFSYEGGRKNKETYFKSPLSRGGNVFEPKAALRVTLQRSVRDGIGHRQRSGWDGKEGGSQQQRPPAPLGSL